MTTIPLIRVFLNGGVVAPADLLRVLDASEAAGNSFVHFSARQDVLFPASGRGVHAAADIMRETGLPFAPTSRARLHDPYARKNIVSSYAAVNVVETTRWLTEDVYQYTLANFEEQPRLKVHLVDPAQCLVPLFGGHVHFVASQREHYWHLYLKGDGDGDDVLRVPNLIHGLDLPGVVRGLESQPLAHPGTAVPDLVHLVQEGLRGGGGATAEEVDLPGTLFPYYEGLNAMTNQRHWLGLYWRNNRFDVPFLRAACGLCQVTKVGKISLTPWKSFIIKGIRSEDRAQWEELTGRFGINLRHSSLELNWHIPVLDEEALELKNWLVRELTMSDISTFGLTFTIRSATERASPFTSVVIEREESRGAQETYAIRHASDFDPNSHAYVGFAEGVVRAALPARLIDLSRAYWARSSSEPEMVPQEQAKAKAESGARAPAGASDVGHRCARCLTEYDSAYGDPLAGIEPGVPFGELSADYVCPVCSAERAVFAPLVAVST